MINWQQPQRQSMAAILIMTLRFLKEIFKSVWPILLITVFRDKEKLGLRLLFFAVGILLMALLATMLEFIKFKFHIANNNLIIRKGVFRKKTLTIPLDKIQSVHLEQSIWHTLTKSYKVIIDTAGTEKVESSMYALNADVAASFKQLLLEQQSEVSESTLSPLPQQSTIIKVNAKDLFKLCITANHIETLVIVCFFVFSKLEDFKPLLKTVSFGWLEQYEKQLQVTWKLVLAIALIVAILSVIISSIRVLLRYANFNVQVSSKGFHIRGGLVQSKQMVIPFSKVQLMNWNANLLKRMAGMYVLHLKAIGEDDLKKKQKVLLPITNDQQLPQIIPYYQENLPINSSNAHSIHKAYAWLRILWIGIPVTAIVTTIGYLAWDVYGLWLLLWLPYYFLVRTVYRKNFRFWINDEALQLSTGVWGRQAILMNWNKVQTVTLKQSPYQRRNQLATLTFFTAGGKVKLPYISLEDASYLADFALMKVESSQTKWM
jgi:putative membrane protein